jgi:ABC-type transport system involved in cytochrome bd biosynthesis fused ATPase/permease subunit
MKVSRFAVLALATAVVFGLAMSPVMAQSATPTQSATDASKDAMKSSSDAMKSSSDAMKSDAKDASSDASKTATHKAKKHTKKAADAATPPANGG